VSFAKFLALFPRFARFIPVGIAGLFIFVQFVIDLFTKGFPYAIAHFSETILGAELTINQAVHSAIVDSPSYNFLAFLSIIVSLIIIYTIIRVIGKISRKLLAANQSYGEYLIGIGIFIILSAASIRVIDGVWGFVPIKDSVVFLLVNINPVFANIF
jgi:hypothetical protein